MLPRLSGQANSSGAELAAYGSEISTVLADGRASSSERSAISTDGSGARAHAREPSSPERGIYSSSERAERAAYGGEARPVSRAHMNAAAESATGAELTRAYGSFPPSPIVSGAHMSATESAARWRQSSLSTEVILDRV